MSLQEIADNRWEREAAKAPIGNLAGLAQILLMGGFSIFFVWMTVQAIIATVTPKPEDSGLGAQFEQMNKQRAEPKE